VFVQPVPTGLRWARHPLGLGSFVPSIDRPDTLPGALCPSGGEPSAHPGVQHTHEVSAQECLRLAGEPYSLALGGLVWHALLLRSQGAMASTFVACGAWLSSLSPNNNRIKCTFRNHLPWAVLSGGQRDNRSTGSNSPAWLFVYRGSKPYVDRHSQVIQI
jgi:hypothetical protein